MTTPIVFISYSHDSPEHKAWVMELAVKLRNKGVDSVLDQWSLGPGADLTHFMETNLAKADRVLMICTDKYVEKANAGSGGVGYEKMIVTAGLLKQIDSRKVIPIVKQAGHTTLPTFLGTKYYLNFSSPSQYEYAFDELIRDLHGAPLYVAPPVAPNPFDPKVAAAPAAPVQRTGDGLAKVMTVIVRIFEGSTNDIVMYDDLYRNVDMSRIMMDMFLNEAANKGLVSKTQSGNFSLTQRGKVYALENDLVSKDI